MNPTLRVRALYSLLCGKWLSDNFTRKGALKDIEYFIWAGHRKIVHLDNDTPFLKCPLFSPGLFFFRLHRENPGPIVGQG